MGSVMAGPDEHKTHWFEHNQRACPGEEVCLGITPFNPPGSRMEILVRHGINLHMSNIQPREAFRHPSAFSGIVRGRICGFAAEGDLSGLRAGVSAAKAAAK